MAVVYPQAYKVAAQEAGSSALLDQIAARVAAHASSASLAAHNSGDYARSIEVRRVKMDRVVTATDPAAAPIEWGHVSPNGSWVPGKHYMRNASLANGGD